jgi:hypothetical protein
MSHSSLVSFDYCRNTVRAADVNAEAVPTCCCALQQAVGGRHKPFRFRMLRKRKMKRIERSESKGCEFPGTFGYFRTGRRPDGCRLQPEGSCQTPVFTWVPFILEIMSGRMHQLNGAALGCIQERSHGFGFAPHSFLGRVIEWPLEAADIEVCNLTHPAILPL